MEINFSMNVVAADAAKREITGRVVTWGEKGYTSAGETVFEPNSIKFGGKTKLLLEHERTRPIGTLKSYEITDEMWQKAVNALQEDTFSVDFRWSKSPLGKLARISQEISTIPGIGFFYPFCQFVNSIMAFSVR